MKHKHIKKYNSKRGEVYCIKCGLILKENCIDHKYFPEFEGDRKVSRRFKRPFLEFGGTQQARDMIFAVLSRRGEVS